MVRWLMAHYAIPTLFVLAGLTAGASRIGFTRFLAAVVAGNIVRGLLLAYFGEFLIPF
jgi:putative cofactor-binding repeat protein